MASIKIKNFSCIDSAFVELAPLTVLIGPQGSGKSVISKLIYFFYDILRKQYQHIYEADSIEVVRANACLEFNEYFAPSAWGNKKFSIEFNAGPIQFVIERARPRKGSSGKLKFTTSPYFADEFERLKKLLETAKNRTKDKREVSLLSQNWELSFLIRRESYKKLEKDLKGDFITSQLFIPAGRSFFTNMGKAVSAFEQAGFLDPITKNFGRSFVTARDRSIENPLQFRVAQLNSNNDIIAALSLKLFGGLIKRDKDKEYLEEIDGRKIPFAMLSSGQQELLPLWESLNKFIDSESSQLIFIEEPEAHLFPSTQSLLIEYFASICNRKSKKLLLTTHSPYVLTEINTLLKAGSLSTKLSKAKIPSIEGVVPKNYWLKPGSTAAYAIRERNVFPIIDEDLLINGEYLDEISGLLSEKFSQLLKIEYSD